MLNGLSNTARMSTGWDYLIAAYKKGLHLLTQPPI